MLKTLIPMIFVASGALAQDRDGNDTAGEWVVDHHKAFGLWDVMCDHRITGEAREERCYIRYVDVFSPAPNFAAQFFFLTPEPKVDFGLEVGTLYAENGFRITRDGAVAWAEPKAGCLVGLSCLYEGTDAVALMDEMAKGGAFAFDFTDRHGTPQEIQWDLSPFASALENFTDEAAKRGL